MAASADDVPALEDALAAYLDAVVSVGGPSPGVGASEGELDALDRAIDPFVVPQALRTAWRTFQAPSLVPFPDWLPARIALEVWQTEQAELRLLPPVLFPVAYQSHVYLMVDLSDAPHPEAPLLEVDYIDGTARPRYASLASFFGAASEAIGLGALRWHDGYAVEDADAWRDLTAGWNARAADGRPDAGEVDIGSPLSWPERWRIASGIDAAAATPRGSSMTVRQLLTDRSAGAQTIVGRVVGLAGSAESGRLTIRDATGELVVWCDRRVDPFRVGVMRRTIEVDVILAPTEAGAGHRSSAELDAWHRRIQAAALAGNLPVAQELATEALKLIDPTTCDAVAIAVRPASLPDQEGPAPSPATDREK